MNLFLFSILFFMYINDISGMLPRDAVLTQTIKGDCTGDDKKEIILVYDIDARFGTKGYNGTCVVILQEIEKVYREVYKCRLSADTKVNLVKIFDEVPPFIEIQWFHSTGGGNTYIGFDSELKRFREIFDIESGGLNKEDIDGDGKEEVFSFKFEPLQCSGDGNEIYAGFLSFLKWEKNTLVSFPKNPYMLRPGITYFVTGKTVTRSNVLNVYPEYSQSEECSGTEDLSFRFYSTLDTTLLSLDIMIRDDIIKQEKEGKEIVFGDHLEILFDANLENDFCNKFLNNDDIVIGISPGNFRNIPPDIVNLNPLSSLSKNIVKNADFLIEKQKGGYEVFLGLNLDKEMMRKGVLGFGIILYDKDREDDKEPRFQISWPPNIYNEDPTTWGNLYLFLHL